MEAVFAVEPARRVHGVPADGAVVAADVGRRRLHTLQLNEPGARRDGGGSEVSRRDRGGYTQMLEIHYSHSTIMCMANDSQQ